MEVASAALQRGLIRSRKYHLRWKTEPSLVEELHRIQNRVVNSPGCRDTDNHPGQCDRHRRTFSLFTHSTIHISALQQRLVSRSAPSVSLRPGEPIDWQGIQRQAIQP